MGRHLTAATAGTPCVKVAVAHPKLGRGGSEVYLMWAVDALVKAGYDVTLVTLGEVDLEGLNRWCGTSLGEGELRVLRPAWSAALLPALGGAALRDSLLQRFCRDVAGRFDLLVSGYNPCDFGRPAVHLLQDFAWHEDLREELDPAPPGASLRVHRKGPLRAAYLRVAGLLADPSGRDLQDGRDLFLANSHWVAEVSRQRCGFTWQRVVYPPVVFESEPVGPQERDEGFVVLGRVDPAKRIEQAIEIIDRLRALGHGMKLHIVGEIDAGTPYGRMVSDLVRQRSGWVVAEGRRIGADKERALMSHRYAIHARPGEAFGIGVAELVKAGCIPFVPALGGPAEIVGTPQLCWSTIDEAVHLIDGVLRDPGRQAALRDHLAARARLFSVERFQREFLASIEHFLASHPAATTPH